MAADLTGNTQLTQIKSKLNEGLSPLRERWASMAARERNLVGWALALIVLALAWAIAVAPALRTLREAPIQREALDKQWLQMQQLASEARELKATPAISSEQSVNALKAACEHLGDAARYVSQGERASVTLTEVDSAQLQEFLSEARSGARARVLEAQLQHSPNGYSGTLTFAVSGSNTANTGAKSAQGNAGPPQVALSPSGGRLGVAKPWGPI